MGSLLILLLLCTNYNISCSGSYEKICVIRVNMNILNMIYTKKQHITYSIKNKFSGIFFLTMGGIIFSECVFII